MRFLLAALLLTLAVSGWSVEVVHARSLALRGEPRYSDDFRHWDYVNPDAPKGGYLTRGTAGSFDNFNRYAMRGRSAPEATLLFDSLMVGNDDEESVLYPLIAESVDYAADYSWVIFNIDARARATDGQPVRAEDVVFSFNKFMTEGVPQFRRYYEGITAEALNPLQVRFNIPSKDKTKLVNLADTPVFPEHYWKDIKLSDPVIRPPVGSGAYRVHDYSMGQYVVYERLKDYWARDLPSRKGLLNFDFIRYDVYQDQTVMLEAFKKGEFDINEEGSSKLWATSYKGRNFDKGYIIRDEIPDTAPAGMQAFIFNVTRPQLSDRRVRAALGLLFDFEWADKYLFYGANVRTHSYFQNSGYMAAGLPDKDELAVLAPFRDQLPDEVFKQIFTVPETDGSGFIRPQMRKALELFSKAGWNLKDGRLLNGEGKPLKLELLLWSPAMERVAIALKQNFGRLGIILDIRMVDTAQATNRIRERDYDMIVHSLGGGSYPSDMLMLEWHSGYIDSTYNSTGYTSKVVDSLTEQIAANQQNEEKLLPLGKALDRVLLWQYLVIPQWHAKNVKVAYWNKFGRPETRPVLTPGLDSWWYDADKAASLPRRNAPN